MSLIDFYNGKTLFVTGGTGFLGKIILAKLMRIGNVKEILLLSRPKKGKSINERIDEILSEFLFQEMEKFDKNFKAKLRIINGDMEKEGLGVSAADREYIVENVEVIIHGAATVRFDEALRKAIVINIAGTKTMLELAKDVKHLLNFVHISTAYSNCPRKNIEEVFYAPPISFHRALDLVTHFNDAEINAVTGKLIRSWPNTYTFTKAISEDMIRQYQERIPISVVRPSIVQSTIMEPVPGYADSMMGPLGFIVGFTTGFLRILYAPAQNCKVDVVPADLVVNSILAVTCKAAKTQELAEGQKIFNCVNNDPIYSHSIYKHMFKDLFASVKESPSLKMIWYPTMMMTTSRFVYKFFFLLLHYMPAIVADVFLKYKESKLSLVRIYNKAYLHLEQYAYFFSNEWKFDSTNMDKVLALMSEEDHAAFPCSAPEKVWERYNFIMCTGTRKFLLHDPDESLPKARQKYATLKIAHFILSAIIYGVIVYHLSKVLF